MRRCLILAALPCTLAAPAAAEPVRIVLLSPATQTATAGEPLPFEIRIRVERANGEPVPGVQVYLYVYRCSEPAGPGTGECPGYEEYGGWTSGDPVQALVTTGGDGTASAPPYRVGDPLPEHQPFVFTVVAYASAQTTAGGFTITLGDATQPIGGYFAGATTVQLGSIDAIPAVGSLGIVLLTVGLAAAAFRRLRSG